MISQISNSIMPTIPIPPPVSGSPTPSFSKTLYAPVQPFSGGNGSASGSPRSGFVSDANANSVSINHLNLKSAGWWRNHLKKPTKP